MVLREKRKRKNVKEVLEKRMKVIERGLEINEERLSLEEVNIERLLGEFIEKIIRILEKMKDERENLLKKFFMRLVKRNRNFINEKDSRERRRNKRIMKNLRMKWRKREKINLRMKIEIGIVKEKEIKLMEVIEMKRKEDNGY